MNLINVKKVGRCRFDAKSRQILIQALPSSSFEYPIDLEECRTAGECLDWIHQLHEKTWGRAIIADFLELLFCHISPDLWAGGGRG